MQMQFKNPEFLYFLALLAVPILVHLLQLRRFKPVAFTNVAALKQLQTQTRKSAKLKRYLLLATRLLLIAAAVLAFAGPYLPAPSASQVPTKWVVAIDNSFSMQAKGSQGTLLEQAKQALLKQLPSDAVFDLYTADESWENITRDEIQTELGQLSYSATPFSYDALAAKYEKSQQKAAVLVITDGAQADSYPESKWIEWSQWQLDAQPAENTWIDQVEIRSLAGEKQQVNVHLKTTKPSEELLPLAVYQNQEVVAKTLVTMNKTEVEIPLELEVTNSALEVRIEDKGLPFDNHWYLATQTATVNPVVVIGAVEHQGIFTRLLKNEQAFPLVHQRPDQVDARELDQASLIILNQIESPSAALLQQLTDFLKKGKNIVFIPATAMQLNQWNPWLAQFAVPAFATNSTQQTVRLNHIEQNHPLIKAAFEGKVKNFEHPQMAKLYQIRPFGQAVMKLDDGTPFLSQVNNKQAVIAVFSQPLQHAQSNFKQSPLAVVALYNLVLQAQKVAQNQLQIGAGQNWSSPTLSAQTTLHVKGNAQDFIPIQQWSNQQMHLQFEHLPTTAGLYQVLDQQTELAKIGFNYSREESNQLPTSLVEHAKSIDHVADYWDAYQQHTSDTPLWKALLWIALLALLLEFLIQKLLK